MPPRPRDPCNVHPLSAASMFLGRDAERAQLRTF